MKKWHLFRAFFAVFVVIFIMTFLLTASAMKCIRNFVEIAEITEITEITWLYRCAIGSAVISFIASVAIILSTKRIGETSFSFWLKRNYPKLLLGYLLTIFALVSMKSQPIWTVEVVYDVLSTQWTIFGLSLTIFLVWNVIIVDFLKKKQPKEYDSADLIQKYKVVREKDSLSQEIETTFSTTILLTINLFLLLFSTTLIYITARADSVFTQNVLHCSYFFTTNSIVSLFLDILKPLKEEKAEMLKNNSVTKEDINKAEAAFFAQAIIEGIKEKVLSLDSEKYTQEEKKKILVECLEIFKESVNNSGNSSPDGKK